MSISVVRNSRIKNMQSRPLKVATLDEYNYHVAMARFMTERGYHNLAQAHRIYAADTGIVKQ